MTLSSILVAFGAALVVVITAYLGRILIFGLSENEDDWGCPIK